MTIKYFEELLCALRRKRSYRIVFNEDISGRTPTELKERCFQEFRLWTDTVNIIDSHTVTYSGYID